MSRQHPTPPDDCPFCDDEFTILTDHDGLPNETSYSWCENCDWIWEPDWPEYNSDEELT